jgi:hypothetical protein
MKASIKTSACTVAILFVLLACDETIVNNTEQNDFVGSLSSLKEMPIMDNRVVSYHRNITSNEYVMQQLGDQWYRHGFITDRKILKLWFPHIFNDGQTESECNYFALYFVSSSSGLDRSYEILSQNMILYNIMCTWKESGGTTGDFARRAMLICDDKKGTLRKSINLDSIQFYRVPDWECESGKGGPNWEEIYF